MQKENARAEKQAAEKGTIGSAEIEAVETEMLLGERVNRNAVCLSSRWAPRAVAISRPTTVGDNRQRIIAALLEAAACADLVITTGGLGPTSDDLTNECLALA